MGWIRSNMRGLARLALFALAVQFTLTFGHVHLDGLAPSTAQAAAFADRGATPVAFSAKAHRTGDNSQGASDFDCPICALIQLASTSAPSVAPPLPLPTLLGGLALEMPAALGFVSAPTFAFQPRGPPAV
jgi:hypothetical protein